MLSSRLIDKTNKCNIVYRSFVDDLYPYNISTDGSSILYNDNATQTISYNRLSAIGSLATQSYSDINEDQFVDCWLPVFVTDDAYIDNKLLSDDGSYANGNSALSSGRIGIENFISFAPNFRSFSNSGQMSIDWILNRHNIPYAVYYGIMCWVRRNGSANPMIPGGAAAKLESFPAGSRLKHSGRSSDVLIKIDNNTLYVVNSQRYTFSSALSHANENTFIIEASTLTDSYTLADTVVKETWGPNRTTSTSETISGFSINGLTGNVKLWVPDGDHISYYASEAEKIVSETRGVLSNGLVSPCLTRYYTNIYRILTLDQPRSFAKKNLRVARCYRKLAHALSTSPFITEFAIRALDCSDIKSIVNTYINNSASSTNVANEIQLLKTALKNISLFLQKTITVGSDTSNTGLYLDTKPSPYSLNNNLIINQNQLFTKLISKYGASLVLSSGPATLSVKSNLFSDNAGVVITQAMDYYCPKGTADTLISNNQTIAYDTTTIVTNISAINSNIAIKNSISGEETASIPLYDIAKPDVDGSQTLFQPKLLYTGYIDRQYMSDGNIFNLSNNISSYYKYAMKTESRIDTDGRLATNPRVLKGESNGPELDAMDLWLNVRDKTSLLLHDRYIENQMSFFWEKLSGPDCEFIENNGGFSNTARPSNTTANSRYIRLKIDRSGKYVIQCTINSPYGTFKKQKTLYVYDGADLMEQYNDNGFSITISYVPNRMLNKWYDDNTESWLDVPTLLPNDPEFTPIYLNRDKLRIKCVKFNRVAISQIGGVFMPINTSLTVRELVGQGASSVPDTEVVKLDELYKFKMNKGYSQAGGSSLALTYSLESGTIAKLSAIYVEKIRSNLPNCEQCYSLYEPKLRATKSAAFTGASRTNVVRYNRVNKAPEGFTIYKYKSLNGPGTITAEEDGMVTFDYPNISTQSAPPVKTYGGYTNSVINNLKIENNINSFYSSNIPGLDKPTPNFADAGSISATVPTILPPVTGFPLDVTNDNNPSKHKLCYQRQIPYVGGGPITFTKGVLHPNSGWIPHTSNDYAIHANRSSVLKFNPGARSTFSFVGPKLSNISSLSANIFDGVVEPNTLSSSISLKMANGVQWDPACYCENPGPDAAIQLYNDNQKHKEYIDTTTNRSSHGYRYLHGGEPKPIERTALTNAATYNDEFGTDQDSDQFLYSFAVTGPASLPSEIMGSDGKKHLRIPTVPAFGIKDIEVKLNFLNYVNTKNLVIWLEVNPDGSESKSRGPDRNGKYPSPIKASTKFLDQSIPPSMVSGTNYQSNIDSTLLYTNIPNNKIANYLDCLLNAENDSAGGPLRLLLLNQEHIENNGYNFSIKFSDNASKYNVLYDQNIINGTQFTTSNTYPAHTISELEKKQNVVRNNGTVRPSLAAVSYSDREACQLSKILKLNKLNPTAASFSKFYTNTLFKNSAPETGPCPERAPKQKDGDLNGTTTFTLKIMVLDETDDMAPNDTLISNQYLTGLSSASKTQTSSDIFNSLCNWELILHVGDVPKFVPHTNPNLASYGNCDALSLLDYTKNLKYPGYSFIADLTDYQHLLPLANIDAPNIAIADTSLCLTNKNDPIGQGFVVRPTEFPSYAIVQILASLISPTTGTLIGTATAPGVGYNQGFNSIISWLAESRFLSTLEDSGRQIYAPSYTKYPFGSPEKILLNVRKPDSLWYSLEAFIMKYHNTPILQQKTHNYIKVQRGVNKYATEFRFNLVQDYQDLISSKDVPEIVFNCGDGLPFNETSITYPRVYGSLLVNYGDLVNVSITGIPEGGDDRCNNKDGLYVALDTGWAKIDNNSLENLSKTISMLENNAVLSYTNSLFTNTLKTDIENSRVIICQGRIPYDIFFVGDAIECYPNADRLADSADTIIQPTILKKGLITKNNSLFSVFVLDTPVSAQDTISPTPQTNTLLVYSNNPTRDSGSDKQYNVWGLDSNGYVKETPPYAGFSAHSVGSYGNVSPFVNKNLLDRNFRFNRIQSTHEVLNNHENDKIKYNKVNVYGLNNSTLTAITGFTNNMSCGFAYSETDLYDHTIFQTNTTNVAIRTENIRQKDADFGDLENNLLAQIKQSTGYNDNNYSFMYLRTSSSTSNSSVTIPLSGCLTIENDYVEHIPIKLIDLDPIVSRLEIIDTIKTQSSLENSIGDPGATASVLASNNIKYIKLHLDRLTKDDPAECHRPGASITNCPKLRTQNKLTKLYHERTDLLKLLEQQAVAFVNISYTDDSNNQQSISGEVVSEDTQNIIVSNSTGTFKISKSSIVNTDTEYGLTRSYTRKDLLPNNHIKKLPPDILPKIEPVITTNNDGSIDIVYSPINLNHYWINIDPKQSCLLDFTSNPKILVSTEYQCIRANESLLNIFTSLAADNNVCPDFATKEGVPQFPSDAMGDEGFSINGRKYKYTIPEQTVTTEKNKFARQYPAITGWKTLTKERYFNINADKSLGLEGAGSETTVQSMETYLIPEINTTPSYDDQSADTSTVPGIPVCQTNLGSPGGLGLIGPDYNSRIGQSTRVQNIFNLDNTNSIEVQIKRIPRLLRGCDLLSTIYRYGNRSLFRQQSSANPRVPFEIDGLGINGSLNNALYCWICLQQNNDNQLKYAPIPPFLQYQNEMIFRSFFGSVDRVENRTDLMVSYYPWELIPYEYSRFE